MEFNEQEKRDISERTRDRIGKAITTIVEWSFGVRPMVNRTDAEKSRRERICLDFWRHQVSSGTETLIAAQNLPTLLVAAIDHEGDGNRVKSVIEHEDFASGMFPSAAEQRRIVTPELALTAFAKLRKVS